MSSDSSPHSANATPSADRPDDRGAHLQVQLQELEQAINGLETETAARQALKELERLETNLMERLEASHGHDSHPPVSEHGRATAELLEERDLLRALIDNLPDYVFIKDTHSRFVINNMAHLHALGASSQDEVVGKTDFDIFSKELAEQYYADEQGVIRSGQPLMDREEPYINPAGAQRWLSTNKVPLQDAQGRTIGLVGLSRDITEHKQAEEALRASEQRFALAVRGTNDGIWDWDIQNETLYWSPRLKELLGYAEDELDVDFDTFNSLMHPDDQERTGAAIETHLRDRSPYDVEQRLRAKSGEYRWFHVRGQAIWDEAGQPLRMVGFTTDITERKQTEAERERLLAALEHRNSQLQTAAAVSRAAASILDPDQLIQRVVDLVRTRFQLYYAGLFLVDREGKWSGEPGRWALLRAGTGEAGRQMLEAGHKLAVGGTSMIGWCTANAQARIALDVGEEAAHFQNPWLPETRSELALPLISRGQVIGAMTIQSTQEAAFSEEDVAVLQTMADQLAAAIENARLLEETRSALAQVEATHRLYLQREWREYLDDRESLWLSGLLYDRVQVAAEPDLWRPEMERALAEGQVVTADNNGANGKRTGLAVPIVLRGETIGVLGLEDPDGMRQWSDEDRDLMAAFSQQLALALENARLLEETQRRAARERLTGEISARMRETLDVDTVLETAIREIGQALNIAEIEVRMESGERAPQSENDHEQVA
jgi:PAS domain S-box-containing protein